MTGADLPPMPQQPAAEWALTSSLLPWPKNPRPKDAGDIAASIRALGWGRPIVARAGSRVIVAGHRAWYAAQQLQIAWVPVRFVDLDDRQAALMALADNRLSEKTGWDEPVLYDLLSGFSLDDVALAGWSSDDLEAMAAAMAGDEPAGEPLDDDDVPDLPSNPTTRLGDIWHLGDSTLICGDCRTALGHYRDHVADLLITDPPYGVDLAAKNARLNKLDGGDRIEVDIQNDAHDAADMVSLWAECFAACTRVLRPGAAYYVTGPQGAELTFALLTAMQNGGLPLRHGLVWRKNVHSLSRADYHYQHEPIWYGWLEGGQRHPVTDRSQMSVWDIDRPQKADLHPTTKPVELYGRAMRNSSARGAVVLEPFAGSGTAYVAASQLERRVIGCELSPAYCDVIIERMEALGVSARRGRHVDHQ